MWLNIRIVKPRSTPAAAAGNRFPGRSKTGSPKMEATMVELVARKVEPTGTNGIFFSAFAFFTPAAGKIK